MTDLLPVSRQKVNALLKKRFEPARKVNDRISWHWWDGFRVAEPQPGRVEVYHEMEFNGPSARLEEAKMLATYQEALEQAGIKSFVVRGNTLVIAGMVSRSKEESPEPAQERLLP